MGTRADGLDSHFEQTPFHASTGYEPKAAGVKRRYASEEAMKLPPMDTLFNRGKLVKDVRSMLNRVDGMYVLSNMAKENTARQAGRSGRVCPGYTPQKDLMRKVAIEASQGRGFARPGFGPTDAEVHPQPGFGQISGEVRSRPGLGQISEVGDPSPGSGQTNGEGSALANGQNTNATNAPSHRSHGTSRRQLTDDFTSASGETTPKSDSSASEESTPQSSISPLKSGINEEESKAAPARTAATTNADPSITAKVREERAARQQIELRMEAQQAQLTATTQQMASLVTSWKHHQETRDVRTHGGLEDWRVDQILEDMSTPSVVWYFTTTIPDPLNPEQVTVVPDLARPESPDERILRGRIFQSITKAVSIEFSSGIQEGDIRSLLRQIIRTGEHTVASQVFHWQNQISSSYKRKQRMRPWLASLTKAASELEQLGQETDTQNMRTVIIRSLANDSRYRDVLRDIHHNPAWHVATLIQHVEHAAHLADDLLVTAKGGPGYQMSTRSEREFRNPPPIRDGGTPSPLQHGDTPYRGPYHRRGSRVHWANEQSLPENSDDEDESFRFDDGSNPMHVVAGFPAELLLAIMIEKVNAVRLPPLSGVGDHHPD